MELNEATALGRSPWPGSARPREHLVFTLAAREYGVDILKVQEIRAYEQPTRVARTPSFVRGVVNLRGATVPIVDLRQWLGLGEAEGCSPAVVIVANLGGRLAGLAVDAVSGVLELPPGAVRDDSEIPDAVDPRRITGLGAIGERMVRVVDVERLVTAVDVANAD